MSHESVPQRHQYRKTEARSLACAAPSATLKLESQKFDKSQYRSRTDLSPGGMRPHGERAMRIRKTVILLAVVLTAGTETSLRAAWWEKGSKHPLCPKPSYSRFCYWTPSLYRVYAFCCGPHLPLLAENRYPQVPNSGRIVPYPCPPVNPASLDSPYLLPSPHGRGEEQSVTTERGSTYSEAVRQP